MDVIIFILVLGLLVFIHELGHFLFAKLFKIRVDEFGFGYPPKMFKMFSWKGTQFTMNWIPFGGFVKIFGQNDDESKLSEEDKKVSLAYKPRWQQALVMFGGILFNIILAWVLFTGIFVSGVNAPVDTAPDGYSFENTDLVVVNVLDESPAEQAGLQAGDIVRAVFEDDTILALDAKSDLSGYIDQAGQRGNEARLSIERAGDIEEVTLIPKEGIIEGSYAVGIALEHTGELSLPLHQAAWYSLKHTGYLTASIAKGFAHLVTGNISLNEVSGPVGIVGQVGKASGIGLTYLIGFVALLSLNLAVLNLIPFPALDGGRILILLIESIIRRRLPSNVVNWINAIGFFILIGFMILVTTKDILRLF